MDYTIGLIVVAVFILRLMFLGVSLKNEKAILADGGCEYGGANTKRITILHILFYVGCFAEAIFRRTMFDSLSMIGVALLVFSIGMLYVVTRLLKDVWTVKLMLVKNHRYNNHWLFRIVKHPNYFLNILPELIGLALVCHAFWTMGVLLPLYAIVLKVRIQQENRLLREIIIPNGIQAKRT